VIYHAEDDILTNHKCFSGHACFNGALCYCAAVLFYAPMLFCAHCASCRYIADKKYFLAFAQSGLMGFFLLLGMLLPAAAQDYDSLIQRARAGDREPALIHLRQAGNTASRQMQFDHILIASWADRPAEVIEVYNRLLPDSDLAPAPLPAHVQQAVARAFRDMKRWPDAQALWRLGLHQYPQEQAIFAAGLIMTLADAGQTQEAIDTGNIWVARLPENQDIRMALAYAYESLQRPPAAPQNIPDTSTPIERTVQAVTQSAPPPATEAIQPTKKTARPKKSLSPVSQATSAQDEYVRLLQQVQQSERDLQQARRNPKRFSAARIRMLEGDAAAFLTRLANMSTANENERFAAADRALARYDELIPAWTALGAPAADDLRRIRIDRLSALYARVRMLDLVQEYEKLRDESVVVPMWALPNVASAYLYIREPERARDLYLEVLADMQANTPPDAWDSFDAATARLGNEIGLYYALTEAEQFHEIEPVLESIRNYAYEFLYINGKPTAQPNPHYLSAQRVLVAADLAVNNTPAAQERAEALVDRVPDDVDSRLTLAGVYRARAQSRLAEEHLAFAEMLEPDSLALKVAQGMVAMDVQDWRLAEALSEEALARFPESQAARRLARRWQVHNMAELRVNSRLVLSSDNPASSSGDYGIDTVFYSQPIDYNWRIFAGGGHRDGEFREGHGYHSWIRGGLEWRSRDLWLEGEISGHRYAHQSKMGARLSATYDLNDYWLIGGNLDYQSRLVPLRALRSNISADVAQAYIRWRAHDRREWWLGLDATHFGDDNNRFALNLRGFERLYSSAHLNLDALFDISSQYSRKDDNRPYFNPKRDFMVLPALRATQILYRRYENVWEHYATLSAGIYDQKYYGADGVFSFEYGQRYRHNDVFEIGATLYGISRPYDGKREHEWRLMLEMTSRF